MTRPRDLNDILAKLPDAKKSGDEWTASCPCPDHKTPAKHLSLKDAGDKALVHCHPDGKHSEAEIKKALGFDTLKYGRQVTNRRRIEATYKYVDANGKPFEVVRFKPKDFRQRRPDPNKPNEFIWNLDGIIPTLYRQVDVIAAITNNHDIYVYVVEGEKDADSLWRVGLVATTNPMGAGKWHDSYSETLRGANIVIIPDADTAGYHHAAQVAASSYGKAARIRILELPSGKDVTEWLAAGHTATELKALADQAPPYDAAQFEKAKPKDIYTPAYATAMTDMGNGERLIKHYGENLRYCNERKTWLIWTGNVWEWDINNKIMALAKATARGIYREVADEPDDKRHKELIDHAKRSEHDNRINGMINMAQTEQGIPVRLAELDADGWLFNCLNGTIDLRTGKLLVHNKRDLITVLVPIEYDPAAECLLWLGFLNRVTDGNQDLITYLQRAVGYSLTGDTKAQVFFLLYGLGNNGKSTFTMIIRKLTAGYGQRLDADDLMIKDGRLAGGPKEGIADLRNKRYVVTSELQDGKRLDASRVKDMTGGETIRARHLYAHEFEYLPQFKLWLYGNNMPVIVDTTLAMWRRVKQIPFKVTIPPSEVDPELPARLETELPGILAWAVKGCLDWQRYGLVEPEAVTMATATYRHESDILSDFIDDCCVLDVVGTVYKADLKNEYEKWCTENSAEPIRPRTFRTRLMERGINDGRIGKGHFWRGIRLKTDEDDTIFDDKGDKSDKSPADLATAVTNVTNGTVKSLYKEKQEKFTTSAVTNVTCVTKKNTKPAAKWRCLVCKGTDSWLGPSGELMCCRCHPEPQGKDK